ncbi:hypothetical protein COCNU_scaffold000168G000010 [Cocos nucifera]|nr:hypothetical protein [Cocos nucifera]
MSAKKPPMDLGKGTVHLDNAGFRDVSAFSSEVAFMRRSHTGNVFARRGNRGPWNLCSSSLGAVGEI